MPYTERAVCLLTNPWQRSRVACATRQAIQPQRKCRLLAYQLSSLIIAA
jgi:hypothetical protein